MALSHVALTAELEERMGAEPAVYVAELVRRVEAALGERLLGAWLFGSAALGDFSPERSDIDVQAVSGERLPFEERLELARGLSHDSLPCPARATVVSAREQAEVPAGSAPSTPASKEPAVVFTRPFSYSFVSSPRLGSRRREATCDR